MSEVDKILEKREVAYGGFKYNAIVSQQIKKMIHTGHGWPLLSDTKKEALDMIATKISRIVSIASSEMDKKDSWDDIAGYAILAAKTFDKENK